MNRVRFTIGFALIATLLMVIFLPMTSAQKSEYETLKQEAEKLYEQGSYALANDIYHKAANLKLDPFDTRWVNFRLADTLWRAQAGSNTADNTKYEEARKQLEIQVRDLTREEDHDLIWAEVEESLGDFWWTRRDSRNYGLGYQYYQPALDWWAGSPNIDLARERYLKIIFKIARPPQVEPYYYYGYYGNILPLNIIENGLKIAKSDNDRAHLHYLVAMTLRYQGGDYEQRQRMPEEFEKAIKVGRSTDWYDDALYYYAEWMASTGIITLREDGQWQQQADYNKALELFRRIISEFKKGETRFYDQAKQQIENITKPTLQVGVSNFFLPDSEIQYYLYWRNVKKIDINVYKVDLTEQVRFIDKDHGSGSWLQDTNINGREVVKSLTKDTEDKGDYKPGQVAMRLDKLPVGAYVIEAIAGNEKSRELILVTDAGLVLKTSRKQGLVYFNNVLDGSPLANAKVKIWQRVYRSSNYVWEEKNLQTNADGLAPFELNNTDNNIEIFASANINNRQAFTLGYSYNYSYNNGDAWKIYAFTDRPAYRPNEEAKWKYIVRRYDGSTYTTPANAQIRYELMDPRGTKIKEATTTLNAFGSAWDSVALTETMPLGEYRINFYTKDNNYIGNATLFRIEEYKLPEFKVSIQTPEENGKKKVFQVGDKVEVNIQADYYFGGAVSNASVEVLVYQNPFYQYYRRAYDYPWYYEDFQQNPYRYYGNGQVIKRETLKTDATGKAFLTFDTPRNDQQDYEYRVEARVVDASRREITNSSTVRVTKQLYYVYPQPKHNIYRPKDQVTIDLKAQDANDQPVAAEGKVTITRDYWYEIWLDPNGREVKGDELKRYQTSGKIFPPQVPPGQQGWQLKFRGYEHEEILKRTVKTNDKGEAEVSFTADREGYYRLAWTSDNIKPGSKDLRRNPISAETTVWVLNNATTELGYRHGGLEIIVDKDTFKAGQTAPVMLHVPTNDRYVLFSIEADNLYSYQLVHMTGTVKLLEIPIEEKHVPNIFLNALMVSDRQIFTDTKQVIVPPVKNFLNVEVKSDREQYQPREDGTLTITARDSEGKPVAAEIALGMVDESVYYIQQDYAGDPRQFYYGTKRSLNTYTNSSFQQKSFIKLVAIDPKLVPGQQVIDGLYLADERQAKILRRSEGALDDGVVGGVAGGMVGGKGMAAEQTISNAAPAGPPPPPAMKSEAAANRMVAKEKKADKRGRDSDAKDAVGESAQGEPNVQVRNDFRSTILWEPNIVTDSNGRATVKVKYPDSLTTWKTVVRAVTTQNQFGIDDDSTRTKQPLIVRLQAPRFFLVGDLNTVSAVINNNTDKPLTISSSIAADGVTVSGLMRNGKAVKGEPSPINVPANGEARVDWAVTAQKSGNARLKVTARGGQYADAMEKNYIVHEHGIEKFVSKSGKLRSDDITINLDIPKARKADSTLLNVQVAPSMAVTMIDALPYLIDYPYGCTEQTMSRFLPAAITTKTLHDLGLKPEMVMGRIFGGINQQFVDKTQPKGRQDLKKLDEIITQGLDRLYDFQHSDGGWGWWKEGESDHFMSAYVVWGLTLAREAGITIKDDVLSRGVDYLNKELVEEELNYDQQAFMLHALAADFNLRFPKGQRSASQVPAYQRKAFDNIWNSRDKLNAYTRALLALSAHYYGDKERANILIQNLNNGVKIDNTPDVSIIEKGNKSSSEGVIGTAHWGEDGFYYRWSDGGIEATSFALRAILAIDPQNKLVEPVTNWLVKNRRGAQWSNTRDTAITILSLNDYLRQSGELKPNLEYELVVNGTPIANKKLTTEDALSAPSVYPIDRKFIRDGNNEIRIRRKNGNGAIYFAAQAQFFSLEEPIPSAGNEIFVRRDYYRLVGRPTLLKGYVYEKVLVKDGETINSGDRVQVVMTIEAKNNYEYLLFEDLKPAGLEAVQIRSGEPLYTRELKSGAIERKFANKESDNSGNANGQVNANADSNSKKRVAAERSKRIAPNPIPPGEDANYTGRSRYVYQELRDRKVALFIDKLPEGVWEIRYDLRAETPGEFHALPVLGHAMYVPEIRCNSDEIKITVAESKEPKQ